MSLKSFESIARAYDGEPNDSHIGFADGVIRERVLVGVTRPHTRRTKTSEFYPLTNDDTLSDLVGVWQVKEQDGTAAYHVVQSDTRAHSGISISRLAAEEVEVTEAGLKLPGAFEHRDIVLPMNGDPVMLGSLVLEPFIDASTMQLS